MSSYCASGSSVGATRGQTRIIGQDSIQISAASSANQRQSMWPLAP